MTTRAAFRSSCLLLAVASVGLGGCTSPDDVSFNAIKGDLTPHIVGLTERDVDIELNMAVVGNQNLRMFWGDLGRIWLFDRPSRLSPYDIIATSGQPSQ
jgi:type IV pilus biogenesis protein CpaD/CtpE